MVRQNSSRNLCVTSGIEVNSISEKRKQGFRFLISACPYTYLKDIEYNCAKGVSFKQVCGLVFY